METQSLPERTLVAKRKRATVRLSPNWCEDTPAKSTDSL